MSKTKLLVFAFLVSLIAAFLFDNSVTEDKVEQAHIDELLKQTVSVEYIEKQVQNALKTDDLDSAKSFLSLAESMNLSVSPNLIQQVNEQDTLLATGYRTTADFLTGAFTGDGDSTSSLAGSVFADFTVIGDIRDLSIEAKHYATDEPVDELVAGLSAVGLALSAGTVISWGTASMVTLPAKFSVSIVKYAAKTSRLTKQFRAYLSNTLSKSVSLDPIYKKVSDLRTADKWSLQGLKELEKVAKDNVHLDEIEKLSLSVSNIRTATGGTKGTLDLLGYAKSEKDLQNLEKFSAIYGTRSMVILKVLGKKALRVTKFSVKQFAKMFLMILSGLYSLLGLWFSRVFFGKIVSWMRGRQN